MGGFFIRAGSCGIVILATVIATGCSSQPTAKPSTETPLATRPWASLMPVGNPRSGRWARHRANDGGTDVDVYVDHSDQPRPVVLLLHGSGCTPEFTVEADGSYHETSIFQDAIGSALERVHIAVVERRGVEPLTLSGGMSEEGKRLAFERAERECSAEYFPGPIPFFGGYVARGPGNRELFGRTFDRVRMLQRADDDFVYQGLPARRWKTFWLDSTPIEDVKDSKVPLFVAQGSRDDTTLSADLFALEAIRQQPGRPIRYVVVDQGNHAFGTPDGQWRVAALFADFLSWALDPRRTTSLDVLK